MKAFPLIPCDLCGSQPDLKRQEIKAMLAEWEARFPGCTDSMFAALSNVAPSLLLDRSLFDFMALSARTTKADEPSVHSGLDMDE
jgi:tRNA 2-thiocytidine biosynthesis protein TtcA